MLNKIHQFFYKLPDLVKFFYLTVLTAATLGYFFEDGLTVFKVIVITVVTIFNCLIIFKPKEK